MVHGDCVSIGCYAMSNDFIEEIWTLINSSFNNNQKFIRVHIFPFKMSGTRLSKEVDNQWYPFWKNLKEGYNAFEDDNTPPNVEVVNKKYVFN